MKKTLRLLFMLSSLFLQGQLLANSIIVKGTVKDSASHPIANKAVKIYSTDSTAGGCILSHTVITDSTGHYDDTMNCNGTIRKLTIIVESCNGNLSHDAVVSSTSNYIESNFVICVAQLTPVTPAVCKAAFTYSVVTGSNGIKFSSATSSVPSGDSIISRIWNFGDSSAAATTVDPTHTFIHTGTYNICLTIKTKSGCQSNFCTTLTVRNDSVATNCKAVFTYSVKDSVVTFSSTASAGTSASDSIISRTWNFGDSTSVSSLTGNIISPTHSYHKPGMYNVILIIKTKNGCESKVNAQLVIAAPPVPTNCKAVFTFTIKDSTVSFTSAASAGTTATDSIISRTWNFGDSTNTASLIGNIVAPTHTYNKPGSYYVILTIKTKNGCESKVNAQVVIAAPPVPMNCKAVFTFTIKDSTVSFTSAASAGTTAADSIISRTWNFGDSTSVSSLTGNIISPTHSYHKPGMYNVTLIIKTKNGCESKVNAQLVIAAPPVPTNCKAVFTFTIKDSTVSFTSAASAGTTATDSIISRTWSFGDSTSVSSLTGNIISPTHSYHKPGMYNVTLIIKTKNGCESKVNAQLVIAAPPVPTNCKAVFTFTVKDSTVSFTSAASAGTTATDSIISRTWNFGDSINISSLTGNIVALTHVYNKPGAYNVTLVIKTKSGCESRINAQVIITAPVPTSCKAMFTYTVQNSVAKFSSAASTGINAQDSIISRVWIFGDNTTGSTVQGNLVETSHTFAKAGRYIVMLYIKTKAGCESKYSDTISIAPRICLVDAEFIAERVSVKKLQYNSTLSTTGAGDSIIQRNWSFGDNATLAGNVVSPLKEFYTAGIFTTCLQVKTANGCEAQTCKLVTVLDSVTTPQSTVAYVKIISINPNPVVSKMVVTVFSRNTNTEAQISIYDIYGNPKMTMKKLLSQGNNVFEISASNLYLGEYFLKVTTQNGADSKAFYKL